MRRELTSTEWALLMVAADVTGLVIIGILMALGVFNLALGTSLFTAILAGGRVPAAVRLIRGAKGVRPEKRRNDDDDDPPPRGTYITGAVIALLLGAGAIVKGRHA